MTSITKETLSELRSSRKLTQELVEASLEIAKQDFWKSDAGKTLTGQLKQEFTRKSVAVDFLGFRKVDVNFDDLNECLEFAKKTATTGSLFLSWEAEQLAKCKNAQERYDFKQFVKSEIVEFAMTATEIAARKKARAKIARRVSKK